MKRDNRGLSLVEMIIVIAILAVVSGTVVLGISVAISKPAEECARKIQQSLEGARVYAMGKQKLTVSFYADHGDVYVQETATANGIVTVKEPVKIGKGVKVSYKLESAAGYTQLTSTPLTFSFDRSTGGFSKTECTPGFCDKIKVEKGNRVMTISLYSLTGKVTVD